MTSKENNYRRAERLVEHFMALRRFHNDTTPITKKGFKIFVDTLSSSDIIRLGISNDSIVELAFEIIREQSRK